MADRVIDDYHISHYFHPVKIRGGVGETSDTVFQVQPTIQSPIYFCRGTAALAGKFHTFYYAFLGGGGT